MTGAPSRQRSFSRGAALVVGLFVLGGLVLWGLFQWPQATSPPAPAATGWGTPPRPVRVATFNVRHLQRGFDAIVKE